MKMKISCALLGATTLLVSTAVAAQSQQSTETYTYDALGRLVRVETAGGQSDGEQRDYQFDAASNRTSVVATGGNTLQSLPAECALSAADWASSDDTQLAWPRVYVSAACEEDLTIAYALTQQSGEGNWTDMGFGGSTGTDPVLEAALPEDETVKLMYIQPEAGSVPLGTDLVLAMDWQVTNFAGPGTTDSSTVTINGTGSAGSACTLGPSGFTVTQTEYAYPRVYAPTSAGCGFQVQLGYTITVESGNINANDITAVFSALDDTLEANEHAKVLVIYPVDGVTTETQPIVLRVNWQVLNGNAVIASPGYSTVTINPN